MRIVRFEVPKQVEDQQVKYVGINPNNVIRVDYCSVLHSEIIQASPSGTEKTIVLGGFSETCDRLRGTYNEDLGFNNPEQHSSGLD